MSVNFRKWFTNFIIVYNVSSCTTYLNPSLVFFSLPLCLFDLNRFYFLSIFMLSWVLRILFVNLHVQNKISIREVEVVIFLSGILSALLSLLHFRRKERDRSLSEGRSHSMRQRQVPENNCFLWRTEALRRRIRWRRITLQRWVPRNLWTYQIPSAISWMNILLGVELVSIKEWNDFGLWPSTTMLHIVMTEQIYDHNDG